MSDIKKYLVEKRGMNEFFAEDLAKRIEKHDDIKSLFNEYIKTGEYTGDAKTMHDKLPHLESETVFEFLVGLREEPDKYTQYISDGARYL